MRALARPALREPMHLSAHERRVLQVTVPAVPRDVRTYALTSSVR